MRMHAFFWIGLLLTISCSTSWSADLDSDIEWKTGEIKAEKRDVAANGRSADGYELCLQKANGSSAATKAEDAGGRLGLEEYLIESCGFRPVRHGDDGRSRLLDSDCDQLFRWAEQGACNVEEFAGYQVNFLKQLDSNVFSRSSYERACSALNSTTRPIQRTEFEERVCLNSSPKHKAKRLFH